MKKLITIIAAGLFTLAVSAADRWTNTISVAAGATTATARIPIFVGGGEECAEIDSLFATVASGSGTGTVAFASYDYGVATTIDTSTAIKSGDGYWARPVAVAKAMYTYPTLAITGAAGIVTSYTQTNYAAVAKGYVVRQLQITVTQDAVADDTVYRQVIITK